MGEVAIVKSCRLSVIIPAIYGRGMAERAARSVLEQADPIGTEIVVVDPETRDETSDYIKSVFPDAIREGRLQLARVARSMDPGWLRNQGATHSSGSFLAFLDSKDWWRPGRLQALEPWLAGHDLILASDEHVKSSADWVRSFLMENRSISSSGIIRRSLFEEVGGFAEGRAGSIVPRKLPALEDYEFWLKCLARLGESGRRERFALIRNEHVVVEATALDSVPLLARAQRIRELLTLVAVARQLPARYWGLITRRVWESGKAAVKK